MKAIVFHDVGDIRLEDAPDPKIEERTDAIVRITSSAICGTDLHMVRGSMPGMVPGTILGHEAVGVVEEVGPAVHNLRPGDRVVIPSTIACGWCSYCRAGVYSQCDNANPNGPRAGTAFFGGPKMTGPFQGLQAEYARIPFANIGPVRLDGDVSDSQAILISDIFPTGWFGADMAEIHPGHTVLVTGCGPVGLFAIYSAMLMDAGRVIAIDHHEDRLDRARKLGAEAINFDEADPVEMVMELTGGIGVDRVIEAVGVDANPPTKGPAAEKYKKKMEKYEKQSKEIAPETNVHGDLWVPGRAPSIVLEWAVECVAKAGLISVIGVYPESVNFFPWGKAMMMNLRVSAGNCPHRRYLPELVRMTASGAADPLEVLSHQLPMARGIEAYENFERRSEGWVKVELTPSGA